MHVPFCTAKCIYCDFYSVARNELIVPYADALAAEYDARKHEIDGLPIETVYFGGGTPSLLPADVFARLAALFPRNVTEFTIEANPDDIDAETVKLWQNAGVNRVSMGVQSLNDNTLAFIGRRHNAAQALDAIACLQDLGISEISADLIYGLPGQTADDFADDLNTLIATGITHLSAYCLSYEPGTRLWQKLQRGQVTETDEDTIAREYRLLCDTMHRAGFEHYEISNFARPGHRSRHNSAYWHGIPYLGLGPGAHSLDCNGTRRFVDHNLRAYIADSAKTLHVDTETRADIVNDAIMTGLRTSDGFDMSLLDPHEYDAVMKLARGFIARGKLSLCGNTMKIAEHDWLVSDSIIAELFID